MISVTGFQIDSIEVTNAQYAGFLAAQPDPSLQPPACASNATFEPSQGWPATGQEALPVTNTDWCDARAFCHWARKHLCGAVGGGASSYDDFANANTDQWQRACTGAGARNYPYGNTYEAATCNGSDQGSNQKVPAGEVSCQGAYPGLFDMSGNVWEWEDACQSDAVGALCRIRGGCFLNGAPNLRCDTDSSTSRLDSHPTVGFRCCRD
jgi:formylglycine-generating enzyme required for sulfatase activity